MNYMELGRMRELDGHCKNDVSFVVYKRPCLKDIGCDGWCTILKDERESDGKLSPTFPTKRIQTKSQPLVEVFF